MNVAALLVERRVHHDAVIDRLRLNAEEVGAAHGAERQLLQVLGVIRQKLDAIHIQAGDGQGAGNGSSSCRWLQGRYTFIQLGELQ
ncbi:hypothetical protein D3C77_766700 [compost metagenome]